MIGIGTDLLLIERVRNMIFSSFDGFLDLFTDPELALSKQYKDRAIFFAERFACKEALFKCFDIEMDIKYLKEIETLNGRHGKPYITLYGEMKRLAEEMKIKRIDVSISQDGAYVIATTIIES